MLQNICAHKEKSRAKKNMTVTILMQKWGVTSYVGDQVLNNLCSMKSDTFTNWFRKKNLTSCQTKKKMGQAESAQQCGIYTCQKRTSAQQCGIFNLSKTHSGATVRKLHLSKTHICATVRNLQFVRNAHLRNSAEIIFVKNARLRNSAGVERTVVLKCGKATFFKNALWQKFRIQKVNTNRTSATNDR